MIDFPRVVVVNLSRRPDRLAGFRSRFPAASWPFKPPERVEALDGRKVPRPAWFSQQEGAWGCARTHLRLMEDALNRGENLFVFEDDAVFTPRFAERVGPFFAGVPDDWQMVYLGGLHRSPVTHAPVRVNDHVCLGRAITTTYAYGLRHEFLKELYPLLLEGEQHHIDQMLARQMAAHNWRVYCPVPWLVGMDGGVSDICGRVYHGSHWWEYEPEQAREPIYLEQLVARFEMTDGTWQKVPLTAAGQREHVQSSIPGWFSAECGTAYREECLKAISATVPGYSPPVLVEVGCWKGRSLSFLADLIREGRLDAWAVDTWAGNADPKDPTHGRDVYDEFLRNVSKLGLQGTLRVRRLASLEAAEQFSQWSVDVVMIDASHDLSSVRADLSAWWPKVKPDTGVMMGHDYGPGCLCPEVVQAVNEFAAGRRLEVETVADLWIIRKAPAPCRVPEPALAAV